MGNHIHKAWRKGNGIREPPDLPVEILIDIFARLDPVTLVRSAATSKLLRRHMTDPAFLRLIRGRRASGGGGFVPSLLVGVFFFHHAHKASRFAPLPPYGTLKLSLPLPLPPTAGSTVVDLCVGSPVTGRYVLVPPTTLHVRSHVLLAGSIDGFSPFRLFVLGRAARTPTFSSMTGAWGPEPAVVIRGVAHWLHLYDDDDGSSQRYGVLSIRVGTGQATAAEVPQRCLRWRRRAVAEELLLVRTADGRLGLLVAETMGIAMWTLSEEGSTSTAASWARRVVVEGTRIERSVEPHCHPLVCVDTKLEWFGEASGTVLFQMNYTGMLLLNLQTVRSASLARVDPVPILAAMKS
ncbi:hypothetical protein BS78_10G227600 [Paspalum vaginatum]|nr:hypothetical protein BS78_10G227600 [Paspalum vaginatum]